MEHDFPYLYYGSYGDAKRYGEEKKYDASFRERSEERRVGKEC